MARSVRLNQVARGSYCSVLSGLNEPAHFVVVLDTRCGFETRAGIDTPGPGCADGFGDIQRIQAAGDDQLRCSPARKVPIERNSVGGAVKQDRLSAIRLNLVLQSVHAKRAPKPA